MRVFFYPYMGEKNKYDQYYIEIYKILSGLGYENTVFERKNDKDWEKFIEEEKRVHEKDKMGQYKYFVKNVQQCDIFILEVTSNSFSCGYLLHEALNNSRPVVALYHEGEEPNFLSGVDNEKLFIVEYNSTNLKAKLEKAMQSARTTVDIRFNFFIPPQLITYLNWISSILRVSKSTYLRKLIMDDMAKNKDYLRLKRNF